MEEVDNIDLNRIAIVLTEKKMTTKEFAKQLGKEYSGVTKNCRNETQPSLKDLKRMADILKVPLRELIVDYIPSP